MDKRIGLIAVFVIVSAAFVTAQEAVFSEINGKVEYQLAGGEWQSAKLGDKVGKGAMVSTGFKSSAVLKVDAISISLKPITRLSLEELLKTQGGTQTQLFLLAGRVKADVPPQPGQTTDFRVNSPTATASVRGTSFEFDGMNLVVDRGVVKLGAPTPRITTGGSGGGGTGTSPVTTPTPGGTGPSRDVREGEFSYVAADGTVVAPAAVVIAQGLERIDELVEQVQIATLAPITVTAPTVPVEPPAAPVAPKPGDLIIILQ
jgi:hypothetical protein